MVRPTSLVLPLLSCSLAWAVAVPSPQLDVRNVDAVAPRSSRVTTLSSSQLSALTPYAEFARAAYCGSSTLQNWDCGEACEALPGFQLSLTGGDGNDVQYWYVGYWPQENAVVVGHEGTDPTQFLSLLTDVEILQTTLDPTLFPGVPSDVTAHSGFVQEHSLTAATILDETNRLLSETSATTVILVGHSLGGALAELDSLFLALNLPSNIHIMGRTFGTPRVGNPAYASFFDSVVSDFDRVNNESDPIPTLPPMFLDFSHPHGEIHIVRPGDAVACPGDDDTTDSQCTDSTVPNILESDILDHLGPYNGVYIGTIYCT